MREQRIPLRIVAVAAMLAALTAAAGCRDRSRAPAAEAKSSPPERAVALARQAADAMDDGKFSAAADLYEQALSAARQVKPDQAVDPFRLFEWRRQGALGWWLADEYERASALLLPQAPGEPEVGEGVEYFAALRRAMALYRSAGWPTDDPDRMVDVLVMAPALQVWNERLRRLARPAASTPPSQPDPLVVQTYWSHLGRLPELLAGWTALEHGRLDLADFQLVAVLVLAAEVQPAPADAPPPTHWLAKVTDTESRRLGVAFPLGGKLLVVPPPAPGNNADLLREWIVWVGDHQGLWKAGRPRQTWRLILGVRRGQRVVDFWQCSSASGEQAGGRTPRGRPAAAGQLRVVFDRPRGQVARRLLDGLNLTISARPNGATPLGDRHRAELVIRTIDRLAGPYCPVRLESEAGRWWVVPQARAGRTEPADGYDRVTPLVAGWLAYRGWPAAIDSPAASATAPDEPLGPLGPLAPTEP